MNDALIALANEAADLGVYFPALTAASKGDKEAIEQIRWFAEHAKAGTSAAYFSGRALEILDG
jgi:hypothetical protein